MVKIVLAIDDYKESSTCQTLLKKLGFDVVSIAKNVQFRSAILSFLPDILIASFKTKNIDGISLGLEAKRLVSRPRVLLLYTTQNEPETDGLPKSAYEFMLHSPFEFEALIKCVAQMARIDEVALHEKYLKLHMRKMPNKGGVSTGFGGKDITNEMPRFSQTSTLTAEARRLRYEAYLQKVKDEGPMKVLDHNALVHELAAFEQKNKSNLESIEAINAQKLEFAKALFKKD